MPSAPSDPETYRRRQRRRAVVGWLGGVGVIAALVIVIAAAAGGGSDGRRSFQVPYGETMSSADYAAIEEGEDDAEVLRRLHASGRPERLTEGYVLVLFPPREGDVYCTYWEFTDEPQIFARLCFSRSSGELVQKLKNSVDDPLEGGGQGQVV